MDSSHNDKQPTFTEDIDLLAGFAVTPRLDCPHVLGLQTTLQSSIPHFNLDTPCQECQDKSENWQCLTCNKVFCSRYVQGHMAEHTAAQEKAPEDEHAICISYSDLSFWCFRCNDYIEHPILEPVRSALHMAKFNTVPGEQVIVLSHDTSNKDESSSANRPCK
ncbi:hypothetical protein BDF19DRAFT_450468 [Syncephalis fuscata]|nr:hypothetical protein BDF19DRAFT_450468 [Syncephalis fuscata]